MKKGLAIAMMTGVMTAAAGMTAYAGQWIQTGDVWRYLRDDGTLQSNGWQWIDGKCYYFDETGNMAAGVTTPDGFTVDADGAWVIDGAVQVMEEDQRQMATLKQTSNTSDNDYDDDDDYDYDDDDVDFDYDEDEEEYSKGGPGYDSSSDSSSSAAVSGAGDIELPSETKEGWYEIDDEWVYYSNGRYLEDEWLKVDGEWYYFDDDCLMVTGFETIDHAYYYFKSSGALEMDDFTLDDVRYTVNDDGEITGEEDVSDSSSGPSSNYLSSYEDTFTKETYDDDDSSEKKTEFEYWYDYRNEGSDDEDHYDEDDEDEDDEDDEDEDDEDDDEDDEE